jgi:archaemetzincin
LRAIAVITEVELPDKFGEDLAGLFFGEIAVSVIKGEVAEKRAALNVARGQLRADVLFELLSVMPRFHKTVYIIDGDAYVPGLNFVFGVAADDKALVFTERLRSRDPAVFYLRLLKEVAHELGHAFGLPHCPNPRCVMSFSNTLADTDYKGPGFCPQCAARLRKTLGGK